MTERKQLTIGIAALALLAALFGAVAWAAPGGNDPAPAGFEATATGTLEATQTPGGPEATPTDTGSTPEATPTDEAAGEGDAGVPLDSPACAGDVENPNPHDTNGDGDGCREVETEDGTKNLPDPAADAHDGTPGRIGDIHRDEHGNDDDNGDNGNGRPDHAGTPGRPQGDPPHGNANGHD